MTVPDFGTRYERLYVAVLTPYRDGTFDIDESQLRSLLRRFLAPRYVEAGIGIIVNPEAGELYYMTREEKRRSVEIAVDEVRGRVPVFAGALDNTTAGTVDVARDARQAGADGLFVMPPIGALDITTSWNPVKYPEVWIDMVKAVVDAAGDVPLICHPTVNPTPVYGVGLPVEPTIEMCTEIPTIVGWKMTYAYAGYKLIARALRRLPRRVAILSASGQYFHEFLANRLFDGAATGSFNYALEPMIEHIQAWRAGDVKEAQRIWEGGLVELHEYVYADYSRLHIRYKLATWLRGWIGNPFMRPPLPAPRKDEVAALRMLLARAGLDTIGDAGVEHVVRQLRR